MNICIKAVIKYSTKVEGNKMDYSHRILNNGKEIPLENKEIKVTKKYFSNKTTSTPKKVRQIQMSGGIIMV